MTPGAAGIEAHEMPPGEMPPGRAVPPPTKGTRLSNWFIEGAMRGETVEERSLKSTNSAGTQPLPRACVKEESNTPCLSPSSQPSLVSSLDGTESAGTFQGCP